MPMRATLPLAALLAASLLAAAPPAAATGAEVCVDNQGDATCAEAGDPASSLVACAEFSTLGPLAVAVRACA